MTKITSALFESVDGTAKRFYEVAGKQGKDPPPVTIGQPEPYWNAQAMYRLRRVMQRRNFTNTEELVLDILDKNAKAAKEKKRLAQQEAMKAQAAQAAEAAEAAEAVAAVGAAAIPMPPTNHKLAIVGPTATAPTRALPANLQPTATTPPPPTKTTREAVTGTCGSKPPDRQG